MAGIAPHDPAKFGFAAKGMLGEVMAFVTVPELTYARDTLDLSAVSTLAFFSLQAGADGHLQHDSRWEAWNGSVFAAVLARAHAAGTRVVLSVSRFSWSPDETAVTVALLGSSARRARLAKEIAAEVVRRGVDGVNVDLEPVPIGQKAAFTSFVRQLRTALDAAGPGLQLTVAITGYFSSYDVGRLTGPGAADAIYLMGYHYAGWWSKVAGSNAPLGGSGYTVAATIHDLLADGVPAERLIVGVPYYGHLWPTATGGLHARTIGQGSDVPLSDAMAILAGVTPHWDPVAGRDLGGLARERDMDGALRRRCASPRRQVAALPPAWAARDGDVDGRVRGCPRRRGRRPPRGVADRPLRHPHGRSPVEAESGAGGAHVARMTRGVIARGTGCAHWSVRGSRPACGPRSVQAIFSDRVYIGDARGRSEPHRQEHRLG